jgi:hypothetical protein
MCARVVGREFHSFAPVSDSFLKAFAPHELLGASAMAQRSEQRNLKTSAIDKNASADLCKRRCPRDR